MCKVLISGFYGFNNAGDEAILHSIVSELGCHVPEAELTVMSDDPAFSVRQHGIRSVHRSRLPDVIRAVRETDVLVSGGGSLLQDATSSFSLWYYCAVLLLAYFFKKPVIAFAQGIGPVQKHFNRRLVRAVMRRATWISVRDLKSRSELHRLGVKASITSAADPAFLIRPAEPERVAQAMTREQSRGTAGMKVGFAIRHWKGDTDIAGIIASTADTFCAETGAEAWFFPLHYDKDLALAREITGLMRSPAVVVLGEYSSDVLMGMFGAMDLNVCVRFHGIVFSMVSGVPVVPVSYDPKIDSLMNAVGMEDVLSYDHLNPDALHRRMRDAWERREEQRRYLEVKKRQLEANARSGMDEIIRVIRDVKKEG